MKNVWLLALSLVGAFLSSLCCFGAFVFVVFGLNVAALSSFDVLTPFRVYLGVLTLTCFALSFVYFMWRKKCVLDRKKCQFWLKIYAISGALMLLLIFYPEILGVIYA